MWTNKKTNRVYIGSSTTLGTRLRSHFIGNQSNKDLQKDILKYGITNFMVSILEFIEYNDDINFLRNHILEREQFYLDTICKANELSKEFYRLSYNKNRKADSSLGTVMSDITKERLSIAHKGKVLTNEHKKNISLYHASKQPGYVHSSKINGTSDKQKNVVKQMSINNRVPILQYSSDGSFIKEWESILDASINLKIDSGSISRNISGKSFICGSYIFKEKISNDYLLDIEIINPNIIQVYDKELNLLGEYRSARDIQRSIGIYRTTVTRALKTNKGVARDYIFKYKYNNFYENL